VTVLFPFELDLRVCVRTPANDISAAVCSSRRGRANNANSQEAHQDRAIKHRVLSIHKLRNAEIAEDKRRKVASPLIFYATFLQQALRSKLRTSIDSIEILVSAVAAWFVAGVFAGAKVDVFVFLGREHVGNKGRAFVLAVAEWLPFRKTAGAEGVFLSGFE